MKLWPFWKYYGGKYRSALRYPRPMFYTIVEPFAGAAGYSLRYHDRRVILVEKYPVVAGVWRYLIATPSSEILRIPLVEHTDALPAWCPQEARALVGFCLNNAKTAPATKLSAGMRRMAESGAHGGRYGWTEEQRKLVATQVDYIRHWRIIEGDYTQAPRVVATWFIDPPYQGRPGSHYVYGSKQIDYSRLGTWCRTRLGQVIACESEGATWLPFKPLCQAHSIGARASQEAIWTIPRRTA